MFFGNTTKPSHSNTVFLSLFSNFVHHKSSKKGKMKIIDDRWSSYPLYPDSKYNATDVFFMSPDYFFLGFKLQKKTDIDLEQIPTDLFFALNKEIITRLISDTKGFRLYFIHIRIVHDFFSSLRYILNKCRKSLGRTQH